MSALPQASAGSDIQTARVLHIPEERLDSAQAKILSIADYRGEREALDTVVVEPYSPVVGAHVRGLDFGASTPEHDAALAQFLHDRLVRYGFLFFAPGIVRAEDFGRLVSLFGKARYAGTPYTPPPAGDTSVNTIDSSVKKTRMNLIWHIDQAFVPEPPRFTALFGKAAPPTGGDTLFANATAAYDLLDPDFARYLETLTAVHDVETQGFLTLAYQDPGALAAQRAKYPPIEAPVIRVHPDTGRKQIFVSELYTQRILGVPRTVSDHLLQILFDYVKSPDVQTRVAWQEGAAVIWDNRVVQHRGVADYGDGLRVLHRAIVQ
ncbi:UNVERIFIED_ORG: taurine dioxygenase [Xanthobacter viscosus]|jgi:taurine dioxygenase|uniref:Taurine catabolism dioxygenase TauD n=1 Tax=Xanthobacter autotrophicus TaxID=280 RepID=A0A6C1KHK0_XANAU|nr:TauD/TfdA family dioxygenase [Xanthobacter autotrophicus]TLX43291.1 taurine catabolism dioxygenase TauD [Xanthobacter autotrophicus]